MLWGILFPAQMALVEDPGLGLGPLLRRDLHSQDIPSISSSPHSGCGTCPHHISTPSYQSHCGFFISSQESCSAILEWFSVMVLPQFSFNFDLVMEVSTVYLLHHLEKKPSIPMFVLKFFMCFRCKYFVTYTFCKYVLPVHALLFILVIVSFEEHKFKF